MDKVLAGDIDGAMAQTEALAPGTLEAHPSLLFRLHCQTFLELVRTPHAQRGRPRPRRGCCMWRRVLLPVPLPGGCCFKPGSTPQQLRASC